MSLSSLVVVAAACVPSVEPVAEEDTSEVSTDVDTQSSSGSQTGMATDTGTTETSTSETSTSESETGTSETETDCDDAELLACQAAASVEQVACRDACGPILGCGEEACRWTCLTEYREALWACREQWCPMPISEWQLCRHACHEDAIACAQAPDCQAHACSHGAVECMDEVCDDPCEIVPIDFAWAGSCEIQLPAPMPAARIPYAFIEVGGPEIVVNDEGCQAQFVGGEWIGEDHERFTVCAAQCQAFEQLGLLRFYYYAPFTPMCE